MAVAASPQVSWFDESSPFDPSGDGCFALVYVQGAAETTDVRAGDVFVVSPSMRGTRDLCTLADDGVRGFVVRFTACAVDMRLTDAALAFSIALPGELAFLGFLRAGAHASRRLHVPPEMRGEWESRLLAMARECVERSPGYTDVLRADLRVLLVHCARLARGASPAAHPMRANGVSPVVRDALCFIDANYRRPITLADVAKAVRRSRAYLTDRVRRETGRTVGAWITERRMAEARRLLCETDGDVAQIAHSLTYLDGGHFARLFRGVHGMPPTAWRSRQH